MTRVFRYAPDAAWVDAEALQLDRTAAYVALVPDGSPLVLEDAARAIWVSVGAGGSAEEVAARVAALVDHPLEEVAAPVSAFLDDLASRGLLVAEAHA